MILRGSTSATWALMVGGVMLMTGLSYVEEQLNSLPPKNFWFVTQCLLYISSLLMSP
uniref:Uncharacterized protein n=1 Tax=Arundo donax TaxID=35708 RepID=A0A0A9F1X9_ARUDO